MKTERIDYLTRLGTKGQIVLKKDVRKTLHIKPGSLIRVFTTGDEGKFRPVSKEDMIAEVERIAKIAGKRWPKGKTSVDLVREQRR